MKEHSHTHSVYTHCLNCYTWGINFPHTTDCGNCGSLDTVLYRPPCCFGEAKNEEGKKE